MTIEAKTCEIRAATCRIADVPGFLRRLRDVTQRFNMHIICFNADVLTGRRHAETALRYAVRSCRNGTLISNSLEMEALLYAAGTRQCNAAAPFGIHDGENHLWVCCYPLSTGIWEVLSKDFSFTGDWCGNTNGREKRDHLIKLFGITAEECNTLDNPEKLECLVLERVALLEVQR